MTVDLTAPADVVLALETRRDQAARQLSKLTAPIRAAALAEQEIADLDEQISQARRQAADEARARNEKAQQIASSWARYHDDRALQEGLREIHIARLQLIALGVDDPGDRVISPEAIAQPLIERDRPL